MFVCPRWSKIYFLNERITENYYFFTDIAKEGVLLYDSGRYELAAPGPITPSIQARKSQEDLDYWSERGNGFYQIFNFCMTNHTTRQKN